MSRVSTIAAVLMAVALVGAGGASARRMLKDETVLDVLAADGDFSTLLDLLNATGLSTTVADLTSATFLAPTNLAFTLYFHATETDYDALVAKDNGTYAADLLLYHIHGKPRSLQSLESRKSDSFMKMENGLQTFVSKNPSDDLLISDMLGRSTTVSAELKASGVFVFKLGQVLIPKDAPTMADLFKELPGHYSFVHQAMSSFQWSSIMMHNNESAVTFFAPFNDAFIYYALHMEVELYSLLANSTVVEAILQAHTYTGGVLTVDDMVEAGSQVQYDMEYPGAAVGAMWSPPNKQLMLMGQGAIQNRWPFTIEADLVAANSIVHGIDMLLVPEVFFGSYYGDYSLFDYDYKKK